MNLPKANGGLSLGRANPATAASQGEVTKTADATEAPEAETAESVAEDTVLARYTSHPIQRFTVGRFQFENGLLTLRTADEVAEFDSVLKDLPLSEQYRIKAVDLAAAENLARIHLANSGGVTQAIDSATGERNPNNQVGTGELGQE